MSSLARPDLAETGGAGTLPRQGQPVVRPPLELVPSAPAVPVAAAGSQRERVIRRRLPVPVTLSLLFLTIAVVTVSFWLLAVLLGQVICDSGACELVTLSHRPLMTLYLTGTASVWLLVMSWGTEQFTVANRVERQVLAAGALIGLGAVSGALVVAATLVAIIGTICAAVVGLVWLLVFR